MVCRMVCPFVGNRQGPHTHRHPQQGWEEGASYLTILSASSCSRDKPGQAAQCEQACSLVPASTWRRIASTSGRNKALAAPTQFASSARSSSTPSRACKCASLRNGLRISYCEMDDEIFKMQCLSYENTPFYASFWRPNRQS